jgi:hypothetical protein
MNPTVQRPEVYDVTLLTLEDVKAIIRWAAEGAPAHVLADYYHVSVQTIQEITGQRSLN